MRAFACLKGCALLFQPFFHLLRVHGQHNNSSVVFLNKNKQLDLTPLYEVIERYNPAALVSQGQIKVISSYS